MSTTQSPYTPDLTTMRRRGVGRPRQGLVQDHRARRLVVAVLGVLIAAAITDNGDDGQGFDARSAWLYVTLLTTAT